MSDEEEIKNNIVAIGRKPIDRYITACITLFNEGKKEVIFRARGKEIPKCIAVVESLRKSFMKDAIIKKISIGSDEKILENGGKKYISYIEIIVTH
jgi:DNA-binding protein